MSEETDFISYAAAQKIVGAVMEEEHIHEPDRRILTVYDLNRKEICWFDAEEIIADLANRTEGIPKKKDEMHGAAVELIMHQIPKWAADGQ